MILKWLEKYRERQAEKETKYRKEYLEFYFNKIPTGKVFTMLELFDPFAFPMIVKPEHVIQYLDKQEQSGLVTITYYLKCPGCDQKLADISKEKKELNTKTDCVRCKESFVINDNTIFLNFKKI